jgi:hypothetical protein
MKQKEDKPSKESSAVGKNEKKQAQKTWVSVTLAMDDACHARVDHCCIFFRLPAVLHPLL